MSQYTADEIQRLQDGAELYQEQKERAQKRGSAPSSDTRRREQEALQKYA